MKLFLALAITFTFVVALGLIFMPAALTSHAVDQPGQPTRRIIIPGEYIVTLKPEFIGEPEAGDQKLSNASLEKQQQNIFIAAGRCRGID